MDDDDYPRFGNAYPSTDPSVAAQAASWNPALRPDSEPPESDDDFFDRYPGATPKKAQSGLSVGQSLDAPEDGEDEDPARRPSISVESIVDVRHDDASPGDLDRVPSYAAGAEGPATHRRYDEAEDEEDPVLPPDESAPRQNRELDERIPDARETEATQDMDGSVEQVDHASANVDGEVARPEMNYEHQGEVTEIEEAVEPSGEASLLADEEPLPTTGHMSRESTFGMEQETAMGFDGAPAPGRPQTKSHPGRAQLDRSFTSNFVGSPIEQAPSQFAQSAPEDWPSFGDDQTFGELLDNERSSESEQSVLRGEAAKEPEDEAAIDLLPEEEGEIPAQDLAAAWGAALDDDDMLADTPVGFDPSSAFGGDDDDGFLEDELATPIQQQPTQQVPHQSQPQRQSAPTTQYQPTNAQARSQPSQMGLPTPQPFDALGRSSGTPQTGLPDFYNQQVPHQQQQPSQRPQVNQAQSFVDKAKGGYQSPYDLPMEVVKPRRRPQVQQQPSQQQMPAPPPRTSSFSAHMQNLPPPSAGSGASMSPPTSSHSGGAAAPPAASTASSKTTPKTDSGFFEDLPTASKPRARPAGQYTAGAGARGIPTPPPGPIPLPQQHHARHQAPPVQPLQRPAAPPTPSQQPQNAYDGGLQQPDRMPILPDQPAQPAQQPVTQQGPPPSSRYSPTTQSRDLSASAAPPSASGRYSPAPAAAQAPAVSRYSPATTSEPGQASRQSSSGGAPPGAVFRQPSHAFAPRTSSPLAGYTDKPHPPLPSEASKQSSASPPRTNGIQTSHIGPAESHLASTYSTQEMRATDPHFAPPPPRPRTQSPDNAMKAQKVSTSHVRRPSSAGKMAHVPSIPRPAPKPRGPVLPHRRQFSRELTIVRPENETAQDPLERWKGHPVFHWSASGSVLTSFPRQTPFYSAGQGVPSLKATAGGIKIEDAGAFMPMNDRNAKFPGPLTARSKGKKKDVLAWMTGKIEDLERTTEGAMLDFNMDADLKTRIEEKLILWKLMRVFVEHDGVLEGNPKIDDEVRRILLPNLAQMGQVLDLQTPNSAAVTSEIVDKHVLLQLRLALFEGQRERAVWLAEEKKLWGHAMLIASTMGPDTWKQIVAAFVRSQVKSFGSDARSMAACYQIFAGNSEEVVDELVPPSARAGFTMVAAENPAVLGDGRGRSKSFYERNPLDGLDSWRETLGLVTSNRTPSDGPSLVALGKLLSGYGRVEAAHACFLFARPFVKHSGADDAEAHFVLLGANHKPKSSDLDLGSDLDSVILTEIYEFASSLSGPSSNVAYLPHFQAFKFVHAQELATHGLKTKAQAYCDHITSVYTSTTRPSPYYHPTFTQAVGDLGALLAQTPHDGKGSKGLFSKPAMSKVGNSASSWFSKFVAGDEDQQHAIQATEGDQAGPFGMVGASPPSGSRPGSAAGMYNTMMAGGPSAGMSMQSPPLLQGFAPTGNAVGGRYAPGAAAGGSKYAPGAQAQPYSGLGIPAAEPQRPGSARYAPAPAGGVQSLGIPGVSRASSDYGVPYAPSTGSRRGSAQDTSSQGSYEPRPILHDESSNYSYSPPILQRPDLVATAVQDGFSETNGLLPPAQLPPTSGEDDAEIGGGYRPPEAQSSGYEPPSYSYQPYEPEPDSPVQEKPRPKQRTYGDEDEDAGFDRRAQDALKKSQADREADEAFRKAAEADSARGAQQSADGKKAGWFGGWFGGKKDPNAAPGPIRAKLGEENSFYYDKDLGKWVNKKGGADAGTPAAATPPPPKGLGGRAGSSMGPPSGPPSRASSGTGLSGFPAGGLAAGRPPTSGSGPAFSGPPSGPPSRMGTPASVQSEAGMSMAPPPLPLNGLEPPSRPGTGLSSASSIDDLLAAGPKTGKGGTMKGKKKGRYVDVMAK